MNPSKGTRGENQGSMYHRALLPQVFVEKVANGLIFLTQRTSPRLFSSALLYSAAQDHLDVVVIAVKDCFLWIESQNLRISGFVVLVGVLLNFNCNDFSGRNISLCGIIAFVLRNFCQVTVTLGCKVVKTVSQKTNFVTVEFFLPLNWDVTLLTTQKETLVLNCFDPPVIPTGCETEAGGRED